MNKVLLIDDEAYILELMQSLVQWEFYGFEIAGTAENAADAMKIYYREQPELIITDICMESISGIELITRIRMQNSAVKIIILSAYDKFEYAQKALKLDVAGYLLKPVNKEELVNTLLDVQRKLETKNTYQDQIITLRHSLDHFQKKYLEGQLLLLYQKEQGSIPCEFDLSGIWCVISIHAIVRSEIVFLEQDIARISGLTSFVLFVDDGLFAVFIHGDANGAELMEVALKEMKSKYSEEEKSFLCGVGYQADEDLGRICQDSREALNWLFYEEESFYCADIDRRRKFFSQPPLELTKEPFLLMLVNQEFEKCIQSFIAYLEQSKQSNAPKSRVKEYFCRCAVVIKSCVYEESSVTRMEEVIKKASGAIRCKEIQDCFLSCIEIMQKAKTSFRKSGMVILSAQEYIRTHCFDEKFSIDELAEFLAISKSYLSKLYKEETKESLWNFVMQVRITKAKEMLANTNATNYTIAREIGYSSEYHFSRAFSKMVGVSPSLYKKMCLQIK